MRRGGILYLSCGSTRVFHFNSRHQRSSKPHRQPWLLPQPPPSRCSRRRRLSRPSSSPASSRSGSRREWVGLHGRGEGAAGARRRQGPFAANVAGRRQQRRATPPATRQPPASPELRSPASLMPATAAGWHACNEPLPFHCLFTPHLQACPESGSDAPKEALQKVVRQYGSDGDKDLPCRPLGLRLWQLAVWGACDQEAGTGVVGIAARSCRRAGAL